MTIKTGMVVSAALFAALSLPLQAAEPVKVGSKIDTEGALLGNIILQVLESHGVKTVNKVQLGTTPVVRGPSPPASWISTRNTPATGHFSSKMKTIRHGKTPKPGMKKSKNSMQNRTSWSG
ncbi:osmoprotectant uptake system substrate-binding protein [Enterobacter cloacae]|uniref:Osmoprotectant uptake system substrate-binding protein n=1 Tax=Enterobacter cloacae TaxID=550 RepID=A0A377LX31_ENTCL|nr:osmoprotectant uptake system substrate-binding protein [Enterobacter cloacae]